LTSHFGRNHGFERRRWEALGATFVTLAPRADTFAGGNVEVVECHISSTGLEADDVSDFELDISHTKTYHTLDPAARSVQAFLIVGFFLPASRSHGRAQKPLFPGLAA
jgi:hypothetical protein